MATRRTIFKLAATADVDPRTAEKALRFGLAAVRGRAAERLAEAAVTLGLAFPLTSQLDVVPSSTRAA